MSPVLLILASVVVGVVGQLAIKAGVNQAGRLAGGPDRAGSARWRLFVNPGVLGGLALYGLSLAFWLVALSNVELSYAYPFISLSYVLILVGSRVCFGEALSPYRLVGVAAVCLGVYAVAAG